MEDIRGMFCCTISAIYLPSDLSPSGFPTKMFYAFLIFPFLLHVPYLILPDWITSRLIFHECLWHVTFRG